MPKKKDWSGVVQGKLTISHEVGRDTWGNILWECTCECGNTVSVGSASLSKGQASCSVQCGVAQANKNRARHGMYKTNINSIWRQMRSRCNNPQDTVYNYYGGRGIKVCPRWDVFENFYADMGDRPEGTSLDRIDNAGDYSPENCRWATPQQQQNNMRGNRTITYEGETLSIAEWARRTGIKPHVLKYRLNAGWKPPLLFSRGDYRGKF